MSLLIGVAGYTGSGKSTAAILFADQGFRVIDADREAKRIMDGSTTIKQKFARHYGSSAVENGVIRYDRIGSTVFASVENLKTHNELVKEEVLTGIQHLLYQNREIPMVLDAALISYWAMESLFDQNLWITASPENRIDRLTKRGTPRIDAERRVDLQMALFSEPTGKKWVTLSNDLTLTDLNTNLTSFIQKTLHRTKESNA